MSSRFLIHIMPRFFLPTALQELVNLVDVSIPEFDLTLRHGHELAVRRPFPNKRYLIPCMRSPRKATEGFIISVPECPANYTVITRWELVGIQTVSHTVRHEMQERELGAASDNDTLWLAHASHPHWQNRTPQLAPTAPTIAPVERPLHSLELSFTLDGQLQVSNELSTIQMPTIEQERLRAHHQGNSRFPDPELAIESVADLPSDLERMEGEALS